MQLISAPISNYLLAGVGNYDKYVELIQKIIKETNVDYYDFNLCKEEFFPNKSSLFKDTDHMNCYGAEIFSHLLADFINGKISEKELFYDSYNEKLKNLEPVVFGVSYHDENSKSIRNCKIISNESKNLKYKIYISPAGGEPYKLQDFSNNTFFTITPEEHGIITIIYQLNDLKNTWTVNITY